MQKDTTKALDIPTLPTIRCGACQRKLGEGTFTQLRIKCPRCKTVNHHTQQQPLG